MVISMMLRSSMPAFEKVYTVAAEYPQHTLTATPTCSGHSGTVLYDTYVASRMYLDV